MNDIRYEWNDGLNSVQVIQIGTVEWSRVETYLWDLEDMLLYIGVE